MAKMLHRIYRTMNKVEPGNLAAVPRPIGSLHQSKMSMDSNTPGLGFPMNSRPNLNLRQPSKRQSSSEKFILSLNMVDYLGYLAQKWNQIWNEMGNEPVSHDQVLQFLTRQF